MLLLIGLCFGSFANALVWRIHQQSKPAKKRKATDKELSISKGRSMCVHCGHTLRAGDLLPVVSWLSLRGRCRYCKRPISWQYPAVELITALLFLLSYIYWPLGFETSGILAFGLWLVALVGLVSLVIYDIRWMLLPNKIIFPLLILSSLIVLLDALFLQQSLTPIVNSALGLAVGGGIFYLLFQLSDGRWIGGGDVKLGFLLGLLVGGPLEALLVIFIASLLGTGLLLPLMVLKKLHSKSRVPFGPFLIASAIIVKLFGSDLIQMYKTAIGL